MMSLLLIIISHLILSVLSNKTQPYCAKVQDVIPEFYINTQEYYTTPLSSYIEGYNLSYSIENNTNNIISINPSMMLQLQN